MAALPELDRNRVWRHFMRLGGAVTGLTKTQIRAAVDAADDWADANATSYNNALPVAARTNLTTLQKTLLLTYVIMRRQGVLRVEEGD